MYRKLEKVFKKIYVLIKNIIIILVVWAIKEAVTRLVFSCPCVEQASDDWWNSDGARRLYGIFFIAAPPIAFWIIGIFVEESTWKCLSGWRVQEKFLYPGRSCLCFFWTLGATSLAPITWVVLIFLNGSYIDCIEATIPESCQAPGSHKHAENTRLQIISQVIAFITAVSCLLLYALVRLLTACCGSMTHYQLKHAQDLADIEESTFYKASEEYYTREMIKKWKTLFSTGSQHDWNTVSELEPINPIRKPKHTHYTQFQNWNVVVAPVSVIKQDDLDAVTIVIKTNNNNAHIDVKNQGSYDLGMSRKHDIKLNLDERQKTNMESRDIHVYPSLPAKRTSDEYSSFANEDTFKSLVPASSTPMMKKKKNKKKNQIEDTQ